MTYRSRKDLRNAKTIIKVACKYFDMKPNVMFSKSRKRELVEARQITWHVIKSQTRMSLAVIGSLAQTFDIDQEYNHATVLHGVKNITNICEIDNDFKDHVDKLHAACERQIKSAVGSDEPLDYDTAIFVLIDLLEERKEFKEVNMLATNLRRMRDVNTETNTNTQKNNDMALV